MLYACANAIFINNNRAQDFLEPVSALLGGLSFAKDISRAVGAQAHLSGKMQFVDNLLQVTIVYTRCVFLFC